MITVERLLKYISTRKKNIAFMQNRIKVQSHPNYDRFAASNGQWSEPQYNPIQIKLEQDKLTTAEKKLGELINSENWVCTDPDNNQWRLNDGNDLKTGKVFVFRENDETKIIDIREYTDVQKSSIVKSFGYIYSFSTGRVYDKTYLNHGNAILAECIFEHELS